MRKSLRPFLPFRLLFAIILLFPVIGHADSDPLKFDEVSDTAMTGSSHLFEKKLIFNGAYKPGDIEQFDIELTINAKTWITTILIDANDNAELSVTASGITLSEQDRNLLAISSQRLFEYAESNNVDSLLFRLLTQMVTYWSKSPQNFQINSGKLGS